MKYVVLAKEQELRLGHYEYTATLFPGMAYLLGDRDAGTAGKADQAVRIEELKQKIYCGGDLAGKSLLYATLGHYRDVLLDIQMVRTLEKRYPTAMIDVAATIDTFMLFQQFGFRGAWQAYPVLRESAEQYDYLFSANGFDPSFQAGTEVLNFYRNILQGELEPAPLPLSLNRAVKRATAFREPSRPAVVLHIRDLFGKGMPSINDYPMEGYRELIRLFSEKGWMVILSGYSGDPAAVPSVAMENVLGKDHSIFEVLAVLSQSSLIIAGDSFAARAGGILGKKTVVLLNTGSAEAYSIYPTVEAVLPGVPCVPCYRRDACPLGYSRCEAFAHESAAPEVIFTEVYRRFSHSLRSDAEAR